MITVVFERHQQCGRGARAAGQEQVDAAVQIVEICRSCGHERDTHREEDGRCLETLEMMEDSSGVDMAVECDCPGWPGR